MDRRTFLKIAGMGSICFAAGCTEPEKNLFSMVRSSDDMVPGKATWYASTCRECPAGCGILAKNREGRVIKLEGNPLHPINKGKLCARGQAALQGVYNPDRLRRPLLKENNNWRTISFYDAEILFREKVKEAAGKGSNRVRMVSELVGESLANLFRNSLEKWDSDSFIFFEPFAYEDLRRANETVFGQDGLFSYKLEEADCLISFGADFLETWISPVEYSRRFKEMHSFKQQDKGIFFHVSPFQSLTGANADMWISCRPGSETIIALGLLRDLLQAVNVDRFPEGIVSNFKRISDPYTRERVINVSGIASSEYEKLLAYLLRSRHPLVLGTNSCGSTANSLATDISANILNLLLDPDLSLFDFNSTRRIGNAAKRSEVMDFFRSIESEHVDLLILNNTNPVYTLPPSSGIKEILNRDSMFVVSLNNFLDETSKQADLILPVGFPMESWDEYGGIEGNLSLLQPVMASLTEAPSLGDLFIRLTDDGQISTGNYRSYLYSRLNREGRVNSEKDFIKAFQRGGIFGSPVQNEQWSVECLSTQMISDIEEYIDEPVSSPLFATVPSIRFFDGRGANKPWLAELPDPLSKVSWQTVLCMHPDDIKARKLKQGNIVRVETEWGQLDAPVYETEGVRQGVFVMNMGQGHNAYGRYAEHAGVNPMTVLSPDVNPVTGGPLCFEAIKNIQKTGKTIKLAHTDGSRFQHGRNIALSVSMQELDGSLTSGVELTKHGLSMKDFPLTPPIPEGYEKERDVYHSHNHKDYRWAMVVDLDKCIGCGACSTACYAENNLGIVGIERILEGREMSWIRVERYHDDNDIKKVTFFPMLCQHCDNAPCESVCPVYAPHHSKEGLNNQIYNRCIGTRFCSQNCPYKVRRFNWFEWEWPHPMEFQLNPDVTVRSKGVMEKCSFCVQRIKDAHGLAKDENRKILDGEIQPACAQTCPTGVFTFGNLMDVNSRVRKLVSDRRAYQVLGYLNTKPAVIYLKKVVREI